MLVLAACQDDKLGDHENSGNATLTLNFNSSDNTLSRAVSSDEDEQIISNAYVFVFNQDGSKVFGQFYNNIHEAGCRHLESRFAGTDIAHAGKIHRERNPVSDERDERRSRVNSKPK